MKKLLILIAGLMTNILSYGQWTEQSSGTDQNLMKLYFRDSLNGYCVGDSGTFLKTYDGGLTWVAQSFPDSVQLKDVYFINEQKGFIQGQRHIYQTLDGGNSFTDITTSLANPDDSAYLPSALTMDFKGNNGVIAAFYFNNSTPDRSVAIHTIDGGATWYLFTPPMYRRGFYSIVNDSVIYAALLSRVYKTVNAGASWDTVRQLPFSVLYNRQHFKIFNASGLGFASTGYETGFSKFYSDDSARMASPLEPNAIHFPDEYIGYAAKSNFSNNGNTIIYKTTDIGEHFDSMGIIQTNNVADLFFVNARVGFACGMGGTIFKTTDGGGNTGIIENNDLKNKPELFPNPAKGNIQLQYSGLHIQRLQLTDLSGRIIKTFPPQTKTLDVSGLAPGIYFLKMKTEEEEMSEKVVLK